MIVREELARRIRVGEDGSLELKRVLISGNRVTAPRRGIVADELAAMANGWGGILVLGVDDDNREVCGIALEHLDTAEAWVREICNDSIKPSLDAYIRKMEIPDPRGEVATVICIEVERSLFVHKSPGGYFRRLGSSRRELSPELLARLFQERSQTRVIRFDESPVSRTSFESLDEKLTRRFLREEQEYDETALRKLRIMDATPGEGDKVTLGGVLLCTREPSEWLPHAQIQCVFYAGDRSDTIYQLDARDCSGPIDQQALEALHFIRRNMSVAAVKKLGRIDVPQFSERALFEALVNAIAHRDYSMAGARTRLHMFSDRVEFYIPGTLANTLTPDSLGLRQYSRNELIVSLLAHLEIDEQHKLARSRFMDRRGDGVPIILKDSCELSGKEPVYELIDDSELRLTIWAADPSQPAR